MEARRFLLLRFDHMIENHTAALEVRRSLIPSLPYNPFFVTFTILEKSTSCYDVAYDHALEGIPNYDQAKPILSSENFSQLLDQSLGNNYDAHQTARMALASTLCIKALRKYQATESVYHSLKSILHRAFYWNNLGFGLKRTDYMYTGKCIHNESFQHRRLRDYGNVELSPAAGVLNYGQVMYNQKKVT
ncbi:Aminotransferase, class IV [Artemisia annua]|uniref:Aminotransferase, class IV n=1 Tax=Artemisia annua TaxID=35608 RepID=A0A2U1L6R9_ARTAN|nr:Aminotransferase, class IV [Artemisia annua]